MMQSAQDLFRFVRWRLVPLRYAGKWKRALTRSGKQAPRLSNVECIEREGYVQGPRIDPTTLQEIGAKDHPRCAKVTPTRGGHPFVNLLTPADYSTDDPVVRLAFSHGVLDVAHDYFCGRLSLDSIQVLYSWPTQEMCESQMWHKDYGDSRSFHWIAYLNDVATDDDGPFVFVNKADTRRIGRSPFIRRIDDQRFFRELGSGELRRFLGQAGESVYVDPSACYHYGSRCKNPRLAIFITFNTARPFVPATDPVRNNPQKLFEVGRTLRPDLTDAYLRQLLTT
jgi:hypothetical protein